MMETEDESAPYSRLFNEGPHSYLLHSTEDGLNDAFPVESIFTEISPDWTSEGFPILLSGSLINDENDSQSMNSNIELNNRDADNSSQDANIVQDDTLTVYSNNEKNRVLLSNDVLLTVTDSDKRHHLINGDGYSINCSEENDEPDLENENVEIIQLLNIDGSITTINKNHFNAMKEINGTVESFYTKIQANKCNLCKFLCESVNDMIIHIKVKHHKEVQQTSQPKSVKINEINKMASILNTNQEKVYTLYLCSNCGSGYSNKEDLKQHMIMQHKMVSTTSVPNTSQNTIPEDKTESSQKTEKASPRAISAILLKKQRAMRKFKCSIKGCPFRFATEEICKKHEACHIDDNAKQFKCTECETKFSIWRICCMHIWKNHSIDLGLITCPMCGKFKSNSKARVLNHMAVHNEEKPFICKQCGNKFKQISQLRNHEILHKEPQEVSKDLSKFKCEICDMPLANTKNLKKHIKFVHDKFKPFICNICGHQTSRKDMLEIHHRQHTGDKPFHCSYCEYKAADKNCLRRHVMRHFGVFKYSCPYCKYQSIQSSAYKAHLTTKHSEKKLIFLCNLCSYRTVNERLYSSHMKIHELENAKKNNGNTEKTTDDSESKSSDETQNFLNSEHSEEAVDTGGITIPASFDLAVTNNQTSLI